MTRKTFTPIILAAALASTASMAAAADVQVTVASAVQARASDLGVDELAEQRNELLHAVQLALRRRGESISVVRLVIQDIQPNRPTPAQLGASPGYSPRSLGVGGAAITGEVVDVQGAVRPVRYRYFQQNLFDVVSLDPWSGAEEAFSDLAARIASGAPPYDSRSWPPPRAPEARAGSLIKPE